MKKKYIKWVLVAIWATVIFIFSSQPGDTSGQNNKFIMDMLNSIGIDLDALTSGMGNLIIRKAAHFTVYLILYLLIYNAIIDDFYKEPALVIALLLTVLYAISDEYHQSFVDGRGPAVLDVLIDTAGGIAGMIIVNIKGLVVGRRKSATPYYRREE